MDKHTITCGEKYEHSEYGTVTIMKYSSETEQGRISIEIDDKGVSSALKDETTEYVYFTDNNSEEPTKMEVKEFFSNQ